MSQKMQLRRSVATPCCSSVSTVTTGEVSDMKSHISDETFRKKYFALRNEGFRHSEALKKVSRECFSAWI